MPVWTSNSPGSGVGPYKLLVRDDGNVMLLDSRSSVLWQTRTGGM
jgi:hypothetical protein